MSESKPKRLFKVAQEFNVSTQLIVETLAGNSYDVDNRPNTKITPEMYAVLESVYGEDKKSKIDHEKTKEAYNEKRQQIRSSRNESVSIESFLEPEDETSKPSEPSLEPLEEVTKKEPTLEPVEKPEPTPEPIAEKPVEPKPEKPAETEEKAEEVKKPIEVEKPIEVKKEEKTPEPKKIEIEEPEPEVDEVDIEDDFIADDEEIDEEIIRGRADKLRGTTLLGKMSLPSDKKPESAESKRKKKRRKPKQKDDSETVAGQEKIKKSPKTPTVETGSDAASGKRKKKRIKKSAPKAKVSEQEVENKIKETMNLMQSGSGKKRQKRRRQKRDEMAEKRELEALIQEDDGGILEVTEFITVSDLASLLDISATDVITSCMNLGMMVTINQRLDANTIELIASEYDKDVKFVDADTVAEDILEEDEDAEEDLKPRAPVVTVMGHVDHGKTSLLDYIKESKVAEGEAGGITQHIGAYSVDLPDGRKISFLDTPGHEAFTAMRARGAQVTDIVILVVAADDSVMPQTIEAINHAQAAGVSIVVAINKMDKDGVNPDKIMQQLSEHNVLVEDWGGNIQCARVSAQTGQGIDDLLEKVLIEAELLELKANPDRKAAGIVLETKLDKGKGVVANLLIQKGTLKVGDTFVVGNQYGRVRAMENEKGQRIDLVGPSVPCQITGFDGAPQAGDRFSVTQDEKTAKDIAVKRQQIKREQDLRKIKQVTLDDISARMSAGEISELNIIIKGDVDGSIEALSGSLQKLATSEVKVNIIHTGVGAISESDVLLATASNAIIIGFQVRPTMNARKLAERENIDVRLFSVIYEAVDLVHDALEGMLSPELSEKIVANVEVRDTFKVPGIGTIAGCYVLDGKITRNTRVRLVRDGIVAYTGDISSLKRFKDDAREVSAGYECGIGIHNFNDIKVGDIIEGFEVVETKRKLIIDK